MAEREEREVGGKVLSHHFSVPYQSSVTQTASLLALGTRFTTCGFHFAPECFFFPTPLQLVYSLSGAQGRQAHYYTHLSPLLCASAPHQTHLDSIISLITFPISVIPLVPSPGVIDSVCVPWLYTTRVSRSGLCLFSY